MVDYFLTPEEDLKKQETTFLDCFRVVKKLLGPQILISTSLIALKAFLDNYSDVRLNKWANNFKEINAFRAFIIYNLIAVFTRFLDTFINWVSRTANIRQSTNTSSKMFYRVLHSSLEKFTDKIPKSTIIDKIGNHNSLGEMRNFIWFIANVGTISTVLIINIYGQIGKISLIFIGIIATYAAFGNQLKIRFSEYFGSFKRVPLRAKSN